MTDLGLCFATVAALAIPPTSTVRVENCARRSLNGDLVATDAQERAGPLLVAPCRGTLKDHSGVIGKLGEIKSGARGNSHVVQNNGSAGSLRFGGRCSASRAREGAGGGSLDDSRFRGRGNGWSSRGRDRRCGERRGQRNNRQELHFEGNESLMIVRKGLAAWPKCLVSKVHYIGLSEGATSFAYAARDASSQSIWHQIFQHANETGKQLPPISEHCVGCGVS